MYSCLQHIIAVSLVAFDSTLLHDLEMGHFMLMEFDLFSYLLPPWSLISSLTFYLHILGTRGCHSRTLHTYVRDRGQTEVKRSRLILWFGQLVNAPHRSKLLASLVG